MPEYILRTQDLHFSYPDGTQALNGISLNVEKGRKIAVLGGNGAGKSTLFLIFNGILRPQAGKLFLGGEPVNYSRRGLMELRRRVGIVFQDPDTQLFSASVRQEVSFGAMNLKLPEEEVVRRVDQALSDTKTEHLRNKPTHFLSYGEKKRVAVAGALVMEPEVVIFDEPTACLDPKQSLQMINHFNDLNQKGTTIILSTHDVETVWAWADQVLVLKEGKLAAGGTPLEIFGDEEVLERTELAKPVVLEIFQSLVENGYIDGSVKPPRNRTELAELLRRKKTG